MSSNRFVGGRGATANGSLILRRRGATARRRLARFYIVLRRRIGWEEFRSNRGIARPAQTTTHKIRRRFLRVLWCGLSWADAAINCCRLFAWWCFTNSEKSSVCFTNYGCGNLASDNSIMLHICFWFWKLDYDNITMPHFVPDCPVNKTSSLLQFSFDPSSLLTSDWLRPSTWCSYSVETLGLVFSERRGTLRNWIRWQYSQQLDIYRSTCELKLHYCSEVTYIFSNSNSRNVCKNAEMRS